MGEKTALDTPLERNFAFYAEYHWNPINQLIHVIFVPLIFWSAMVMLSFIPGVVASVAPEAAKAFPLLGVVGDNAALVPGAMYMLFYIYLGVADGKPLLGALAAAMIAGLVYGANVFATTFTAPPAAPLGNVWNVALLVHALGWLVQVYGHSVHEGRSPAVLDNLFQSIFMAPIFVLMEVLLKLGFLSDFHAKLSVRVEKAIKEYRARSKKNM